MVGCLIAGSKCTKKNGATAVIPGSHLWSHDRIPRIDECTYAEMEPGSALFTLGSTYHGAGENKCEPTDPDALRTLFAVFGQRDYFRQDQEEILSTPIEIARKLPEEVLRLAGYCERSVLPKREVPSDVHRQGGGRGGVCGGSSERCRVFAGGKWAWQVCIFYYTSRLVDIVMYCMQELGHALEDAARRGATVHSCGTAGQQESVLIKP